MSPKRRRRQVLTEAEARERLQALIDAGTVDIPPWMQEIVIANATAPRYPRFIVNMPYQHPMRGR